MKFSWWVALRYLKAKRRQKFISLITWISMLGIVIGVMTLITVISVMSGFDRNLTEKIVGVSPHIVIQKDSGIKNYSSIIKKIETDKGVEAVSPLIEGPVLISSKYAALAIVLRGINPEEEVKVTSINKYITKGNFNLKDKKGIVIGEELAKRLGVELGDSVTIVPSSARYKENTGFEIIGLFKCGMYEYDANLAYVYLKHAQEFFSLGSAIQGLGVRVHNYYDANNAAERIRKLVGSSYTVRSWIEARYNLFTALKMEKTVMFVVVALVIVVATFNIASTLIMIVMEKNKDIAILKTIGASSKNVMAVFVYMGSFIGFIGTAAGVIAGIRLAKSLDGILNFLNRVLGVELFSPKIYYLDKLPVYINPRDVVTIILCSLGLSVLATIYPAWTASRLRPVEALRYE